MAKQSKAKKAEENVGKGKVTPVQVAFIVDRYLSDNNFTETRSVFRTEAASIMTKTQAREAPKSLLSLGAILDEYICLKEQKLILDQERGRVEQEKARVEKLLQGMKDAMNVYNGTSPAVSPPPLVSAGSVSNSMAMVPQLNPNVGSPSATSYTMNTTPTTIYTLNRTPIMNSVPWVSRTPAEPSTFSTPSTSLPSLNKRKSTPQSSLPPQTKRKSSRVATDAPRAAKRACSKAPAVPSTVAGPKVPSLQVESTMNTPESAIQRSPPTRSSPTQSTSPNCLPSGSSVQQSFVGKCLFKQPSPTLEKNSQSPKTPPQPIASQVDKSISPVEPSTLGTSSRDNTLQGTTPKSCPPIPTKAVIATPTNCPVIPSKMVIASPSKNVSYYSMERRHFFSCSSPAKTNTKKAITRDHVKGRLDFGASDMPMNSEMPTSSEMPITAEIPVPGSSGEMDIFDMELPNLDFIANLSLADFLADADFDSEPGLSPATDVSGSPYESGLRWPESDANQPLSELSSSVTEVLCEKNMNFQGSDNLTSVRTTVTKCITISSPAKNRTSSGLDQENLLTRSCLNNSS